MLCIVEAGAPRGRRHVGGRDAVAELPGEVASRGEAGSGVAEERGRSDVQQQTCMCSVYETFFFNSFHV